MRQLLLLVIVFACIVSCNKSSSSSPSPAPAKLKKEITLGMGGKEFEYNNEGKNSRYSGMTGTDSYGYSEVNYADGRITSIIDHESVWAQPMKKVAEKVFKYDAAKRLQVIFYAQEGDQLSANATDRIRYEFQYKTFSRFPSSISYYYPGTAEPSEKYEFIFDSRGNVREQKKLTWDNQNGWRVMSQVRYEYEPVYNPLYQMGDPLSFATYYSRDYWVKMSIFDKNSSEYKLSATRSYKTEGDKIISSKATNQTEEVKYEYY